MIRKSSGHDISADDKIKKNEDSQAKRPSQSVPVWRAESTLDSGERSVGTDTRCHSSSTAVTALRLRRHLQTFDQQSSA